VFSIYTLILIFKATEDIKYLLHRIILKCAEFQPEFLRAFYREVSVNKPVFIQKRKHGGNLKRDTIRSTKDSDDTPSSLKSLCLTWFPEGNSSP